ncbi:MAG: M56 family metallopeptidase [Muribaculaceae bacterium]|nr:M56 family metallopeptidase [Muribaculaceae bacterium]
MATILVFLIKVNLLIAVMYLVYKWLLSRDKQPRFNRVLLMGFYLLAPLAVILKGMSGRNAVGGTVAGGFTTADWVDVMLANAMTSAREPEASVGGRIVLIVWMAGIIAVAAMMIYSWIRMRRIMRDGVEVGLPEGRLIVARSAVSPFSIGSTVVMSSRDYGSCGEMILAHERAHIRCRHTWDIVVAQMFAIVSWFNPAAWLMISELRDVHEYQADEAVLNAGYAPGDYQMLLIKKAVGTSFAALANSLNHSNLKKRITMMQKSESARCVRLRALALAPALLAALAATGLPAVSATLGRLADVSLIPAATVAPIAPTGEITPDGEGEGILPSEGMMPVADSAGKVSEISSDAQAVDGDVALEAVEAGEKDVSDPVSGSEEKGNENVIYLLDGKEINLEELKAIPPSDIASMDVDKSGAVPVIRISTKAEGKKASKVYTATEVLPEFPGGIQAMMGWLAKNIEYPDMPAADMPKETVRVVVKFVVDTDGSIIDPEIMRSGGADFDANALKAIKGMPRWNPGMNEGVPVATSIVIPVNFATEP